jgi:hypothetical protein
VLASNVFICFIKYILAKLANINLIGLKECIESDAGREFGPKRDEVTGEWRKLHNEELRDLYSSPSIIRIIK